MTCNVHYLIMTMFVPFILHNKHIEKKKKNVYQTNILEMQLVWPGKGSFDPENPLYKPFQERLQHWQGTLPPPLARHISPPTCPPKMM